LDTYLHEKPAKLTHLCVKCQILSIARYCDRLTSCDLHINPIKLYYVVKVASLAIE